MANCEVNCSETVEYNAFECYERTERNINKRKPEIRSPFFIYRGQKQSKKKNLLHTLHHRRSSTSQYILTSQELCIEQQSR